MEYLGFWRRLLARPVVVAAVFAFILIFATVSGRMLVLPGSSVALVWPAAGVALLWVVWARSREKSPVVPLILIVGITTLLNAATGAPVVLASLFGLANSLQAGVAARIFHQWVPPLRLRDAASYLWLLLGSVAGSLAGAVVAAGGTMFVGGSAGPALLSWVVRSTAGMVLVGSVGLVLYWACNTVSRQVTKMRTAELVVLIVLTLGLFSVLFLLPPGIPLGFTLLVPAVWISMRFNTVVATLFAFFSGATLIGLTLSGLGPFQGSPVVTAHIAQLFLLVSFSITTILALARDERQQLIMELRASRQESQSAAHLRDLVISKMSDGVYVADAQGQTLLQNDAAKHLLAREAPVGSANFVEHYAITTEAGNPYPQEELPLLRALRGHTVSRAMMNVQQPDGTVRHLSVDAVPLPLGKDLGAVAVFRDVTDEQRYQEQLSRFAAIVAHDLGNPLTVFNGWLELLEEDVHQPTHKHAVASMRNASTRMKTLIASLLTYSSAKNGVITARPVHIGSLITGLAELRGITLAAKKTAPAMETSAAIRQAGTAVQAAMTVEADVYVAGDEALLTQLFDNILGNSLKYSKQEYPALIDVSCHRVNDDGTVIITLADNGIGIPEEDADKVFTEFHRSRNGATHAQGFGLGLSICHRIVRSHKGKISIANGPQGGCIVTISLPATPTHDQAKRTDTSQLLAGSTVTP